MDNRPGEDDVRDADPGPAINAPWPSLAIVAAILVSYAWQTMVAGSEAAIEAYGFAPANLDQGRWWTLISVQFIHGGWAHAIMNAVGALAFGPPVARLFGGRPEGVAGFFLFYLACGALSLLGYSAFHAHEVEQVVGASGAVSGLMGAASRLFNRQGRLAPIFSAPVLSLAAGWAVANFLLAVFGATPLMPGARIAWEAHIAGFAAGVLLIGPAARVFGRHGSSR